MSAQKKILFAKAPLLAIAMAIFSFFRIYGKSIDRRHKSWSALVALKLSGVLFGPLILCGFDAEGESVSSVARRHGIAENLLYRWWRLLQDGRKVGVGCDSDVVGSQEVRRLKEQVRELERLLGRKTLENEILKEAVEHSRSKKNRSCGRTGC